MKGVVWEGNNVFSDDFKDLCTRMLLANPLKRIPLSDVLEHPFLMVNNEKKIAKRITSIGKRSKTLKKCAC